MTSEVRHSTRIEEIPRKSWDALGSEKVLANYDWLRTLETIQRLQLMAAYWWIEDEHGVIAAVAAVLRAATPPARNIDHRRYGPLAHIIRPLRHLLQPRLRPTLECGAQMAPGNPILTRRGLGAEDHRVLVTSILDVIESHCRTNRWNLVFRAIGEADEILRRVFADRAYLNAPEWPNTVLDVRWNSWPAYLNHLKQAHPATEKSIRLQINRGRRGGVTIEELDDPSEFEAEIHRIVATHFTRKSGMPFPMGPEFPTLLKKNLGDRAVINVARRNERIIGVSICLRNRTVMHLKFLGIATEAVRSRDAVYFNLAFHRLIERACRDGCEQVYFGTLTYQVKCSRGATLVPVSSWIWQPNRLLAGLQRAPLAYEARRQKRLLKPFN